MKLKCPHCGPFTIRQGDPFVTADLIEAHGVTHGKDLRRLAAMFLVDWLAIEESAKLREQLREEL